MPGKLSILCVLPLLAALLAGCSSTTLSGSWKNPDFNAQISKVYVVGVAKNETSRRMYETRFAQELENFGVVGTPSYKDLPDVANASKEAIAAQIRKNGDDSVLITRVVGRRTEEVVTPGRISGDRGWPLYGYSRPYAPAPYSRYWGSYYDRCCYEIIYEPPTITQYEVATIEANLYQASTGELIWSARLETVVESSLESMISDFIHAVIRDLRQQGLI